MTAALVVEPVAQGLWRRSWKADPAARELADRHYNRQRVGHPQFVPPGRALVLRCEGAVWITSAPIAAYVRHAWAGAWVNSLFRNERPDLHVSSDLILDALACSRAVLGEPPELGNRHVRRRAKGATEARARAVLQAGGLPPRRVHQGRALGLAAPARRLSAGARDDGRARLPGSRTVTGAQTMRVRACQAIAVGAAVELANKHPGHVFVVIAVDTDETGLSAYGTGIGHPEDVDVEPDLILRAALNSQGQNLPEFPS